MKKNYDCIITNPPYQKLTNLIKSDNNKQGGLWWDVVKETSEMINDNGIMAFIIPTSIFSSGRFGTDKHKLTYLKNRGFNITHINANVNKHFKESIEISSVIWVKNNNVVDNIKIVDLDESIDYNFNYPLPYIVSKINNNIIKKCYNHKKWKFTEKNNASDCDAVVSINGGRFKKYSKLFVGLNSDTKNNSQSMIIPSKYIKEYNSIFKSKLFRYIFVISGGESGQSSTGILQNLPMVDIKLWNDDELYKYFNLTDQEVECIEGFK